MATKRVLTLDIETTGLDPKFGAVILSIGVCVERAKEPGVFDEFYVDILPTIAQWNNASKKALEVNGFTWDYLVEHGVDFRTAIEALVTFFTEKKVKAGNVLYVGQNPTFDLTFLSYYAAEALVKFIPLSANDGNVLDTRLLYGVLMNRRAVPFLQYKSSENLSKALGLPPEPWPHNGLEGARAVLRNYLKMLELGVRDV